MTRIFTFAAAAMIAVATQAAAATAQSFDPDLGTGNIVQLGVRPIVAENAAVRPGSHRAAAARQNGLHAFALVPGGSPGRNPNDPTVTGGGSAGYNEMLQSY